MPNDTTRCDIDIKLNEAENKTPVINIQLSDLCGSLPHFYFTTQQSPANAPMQVNFSSVQPSHTENRIMSRLPDTQEDDHDSSFVPYMSFKKMLDNDYLLQGMYRMGYIDPSIIQEITIPLILADPPRNLIVKSHSKSGKTLSFILSLIKIIDPNLKQTQVICLAPSYAQAHQILSSIQILYKHLPITSTMIDAATEPLSPHSKQLIDYHIIVGTPANILKSLQQKCQKINVNHLKILILDEADSMLDHENFCGQSISIRKLIPANPQILLFSTTFPLKVRTFACKFVPFPSEINLRVEGLSLASHGHYYTECVHEKQRYEAIYSILNTLKAQQSIIFCQKQKPANDITKELKKLGHSTELVCLRMTQEEHVKVINEFTSGKFKVLVTTNLLSRAIDTSKAALVINYDLPLDKYGYNPDPDVYFDRVSCIVKFGHTGISITLGHLSYIKYLEDHFKIKMKRVSIEDEDTFNQLI